MAEIVLKGRRVGQFMRAYRARMKRSGMTDKAIETAAQAILGDAEASYGTAPVKVPREIVKRIGATLGGKEAAVVVRGTTGKFWVYSIGTYMAKQASTRKSKPWLARWGRGPVTAQEAVAA